MACSAAVEELVEVEQCLHDHDRASRGQISPNRLCHVCGPLAEMAPDHSRAITTAHHGQREAGTAMTATPRKDFSTLIHKG
jgi:hypothetical protein